MPKSLVPALFLLSVRSRHLDLAPATGLGIPPGRSPTHDGDPSCDVAPGVRSFLDHSSCHI